MNLFRWKLYFDHPQLRQLIVLFNLLWVSSKIALFKLKPCQNAILFLLEIVFGPSSGDNYPNGKESSVVIIQEVWQKRTVKLKFKSLYFVRFLLTRTFYWGKMFNWSNLIASFFSFLFFIYKDLHNVIHKNVCSLLTTYDSDCPFLFNVKLSVI